MQRAPPPMAASESAEANAEWERAVSMTSHDEGSSLDAVEQEVQESSSAVEAWSSSHLSDDDSDEEDTSSSSHSPSHSAEDDERGESNHSEGVEELADNWMVDMEVDLPDGSTHANAPLATTTNAKAAEKRSGDRGSSGASTTSVRPPESVESLMPTEKTEEPVEESPRLKPVSRLTPPLVRKLSLNSAEPSAYSPRRGSLSPPTRLQRSPSKTSSLSSEMMPKALAPVPQLPPTSPKRPSIAGSPGLLKPGESRGIVSTSSQFWASEQNRRSSRLLDEWKRKEIWHDFKKAEENILTHPIATEPTTVEAASVVAASSSSTAQEAPIPASSADLDDILLGVRSNLLTKQGQYQEQQEQQKKQQQSQQKQQQKLPLRRATSFAMKMNTSPGKNPPPTTKSDWLEENFGAIMAIAPMPKQQKWVEDGSVAKAEFDRLLDEKKRLLEDKKRLTDDLDARQRAVAAEQEQTRVLQERVVNLENSDRENRFLKEEIQKHMMHELSSKELVKTLEDQLALTARSEDQLKLQTRQLMQQNQTLQTDLLEKIATETSKIQKMAHLSSEKQKLQDELKRTEEQSTQRLTLQKSQVQTVMLRHLVTTRRLGELRAAFMWWRADARSQTAVHKHAASILLSVAQRLQIKTVARAFKRLHSCALEGIQDEQAAQAEEELAVLQERLRAKSHNAGALVLSSILRKLELSDKRRGWETWRAAVNTRSAVKRRLTLACTKLKSIWSAHARVRKERAFTLWRVQSYMDGQRLGCERAKQVEVELAEAKDCVFSLSRTKRRLDEKLEATKQDLERASDQLREHKSELQLVKHGYVSTVVRAVERQWLRSMFDGWRVQTQVGLCAKEYQLQLEMAELKVEEREKHARSLDDYNKVLRNDLERFQFFSQDKRIAVDVLTKKLLREEEKRKQMEEQQVLLEEKMLKYKSQLSSVLEWQGTTGTGAMSIALVQLCRDAVVGNLRELFEQLASAQQHQSKGDKSAATGDDGDAAGRLRVCDLVQFLCASNVLCEAPHAAAASEVGALVRRCAPDYAESQGLTFADFVACLNGVAREAFEASDKRQQVTKSFWSLLLNQVASPTRGVAASTMHRDAAESASIHTGRSPWAGQLSEDILQNQEKLLAVLEHETAVVERAVMEKSSLKHTYAQSEHSVGSTVKEFQEYQCDPVVSPDSHHLTASTAEPPPPFLSADCQFMGTGLSQFANWSQSGQVQDLFTAFRRPLHCIVTKYSNERRVAAHGNQICIPLSGVSRMLEDMRLHPAYVTRELVHHHFGRLCDRDGLLTPLALAMFLGCCALELFAKSLPNAASNASFRLSAREVALSFFCDLGFLTDSEIPAPPLICLVGVDVEAVLWPLFEYYAISEQSAVAPSSDQTQDPRVAMTLPKFIKFAADIVNTTASLAERLFQRVIIETRRPGAASGSASAPTTIHFDEFYVAIAYLQEDRCPNVRYANLGEALRHWMQQTQ